MNDNDLMILKKALKTVIDAIDKYVNSGKDEDKKIADELLDKVQKILAEKRMKLGEVIDALVLDIVDEDKE